MAKHFETIYLPALPLCAVLGTLCLDPMRLAFHLVSYLFWPKDFLAIPFDAFLCGKIKIVPVDDM